MVDLDELEDYVRRAPLADTHEHTVSERTYVSQPADVLRDLFFTYAGHDLVAAGAPQAAVERLLHDHEAPVGERFAAVAEAWSRCVHTGYGEAVRLAARDVYGIEDVTPAALEAAAPHATDHRPGERLRLLRDVAGLAYVQIDDFRMSAPPDPGEPDFFLTDLSVGQLASGDVDPARLRESTGVDVRDLESLEEALQSLFEREAPSAIALKSDHAYFRSLGWRPRARDEVRPLAALALAGELDDQAAREALGDWCLARCVELASAHSLPVKLHTGYIAGTNQMQASRLAPGQLSELLIAHPGARFVLMHTAYPHGGELLALAKHFPGVYVDLSWGWSIDPLSVVDFLRRAIHTIPSNKVLGFGGDSFSPVESVGYARQAREWLLRALHGEIADGLLDAAGALDLARRWMGASQAELFDLDGTRAALRERIGDGSADEPGVSADALELVAAALTA